jgi:hypothetical protein
MKKLLASLVIAAAASAATIPAQAQSDPAAFARAHVQKIAAGDTAALASDYRSDAFLWWVGGPLDGSYAGPAIESVWKKFAAAQGTLQGDVSDVTVAANPRGQTVIANATYRGDKGTLNIRQVMLVRGGRVQDEIWQIVPAAK